MEIWYDLDAALKDKGMSRYALALAAKLEPSTVYKLEKRPVRTLEVRTLEKIADALGVAEPLTLLRQGRPAHIKPPKKKRTR